MSEPRDVDGDRFGWRESGTGQVPVLLLHGLGGSRLSWELQLRRLGQRRVIAWDVPGYGASAAVAPLTFAALSGAVADLLDELELAEVHLVGLSFGGMVAQYAAADHPQRIRSLSLLSTSPVFGLDGTAPESWRSARMAPLDAGQTPADFAEAVLRAVAGPQITDSQLQGQCLAMSRISSDGLRAAIDCLVTHDSRARLHEISAPTQVLVGECDDETPLAYAQALADGIDDATLEVIPDAGHLLNAEAPGTTNLRLTEHFDRTERR
jgi:3-oxoadipate enol-lactonase